jgi:molybdate transport system permease protein
MGGIGRWWQMPFLNLAFGLVLGLYLFFIVGVLAADFYYLASVPEGREEFHRALRDPEVLHAVWLSVWTSTASALIGIAVAVPGGYVLSRARFPGVRLLDAMVDVPIVLPPLVFGISLMVLFQRTFVGPALLDLGLRFVFRPAGIVLVQTLIVTAFGTRMMKGAFDAIDPRLAAVARTLGATSVRTFFAVTIAQARNSVVAAVVMMWALALALYGPVMAFAGSTVMRTEVMSTRMFLMMNVARLEAALVLALLMIVLALTVLVVVKVVGGREVSRVARLGGG